MITHVENNVCSNTIYRTVSVISVPIPPVRHALVTTVELKYLNCRHSNVTIGGIWENEIIIYMGTFSLNKRIKQNINVSWWKSWHNGFYDLIRHKTEVHFGRVEQLLQEFMLLQGKISHHQLKPNCMSKQYPVKLYIPDKWILYFVQCYFWPRSGDKNHCIEFHFLDTNASCLERIGQNEHWLGWMRKMWHTYYSDIQFCNESIENGTHKVPGLDKHF